MKKVKMFFKGSSGIENPVDFNGSVIKIGDILTGDYHGVKVGIIGYSSSDDERVNLLDKPLYEVKGHQNGGLFAESINPEQYLYLHDFRFKYTKIVNR